MISNDVPSYCTVINTHTQMFRFTAGCKGEGTDVLFLKYRIDVQGLSAGCGNEANNCPQILSVEVCRERLVDPGPGAAARKWNHLNIFPVCALCFKCVFVCLFVLSKSLCDSDPDKSNYELNGIKLHINWKDS